MRPLAFVGGTGPEGVGLAMRFAATGEAVIIGSRLADRAETAARRIRDAVPGARATGCPNEEALARSDRVFLTFPFAGLQAFLDASGATLDGKLLVDVLVPLAVRAGLFELLAVPGAPSAGELIQARLPRARVVSAFKNLSAEKLLDVATPLEGDVVLCGNDPAARTEVAALVVRIPRLRPVDAGEIANARYVEAITALLLNLNRRHKATTSIRILGLRGC